MGTSEKLRLTPAATVTPNAQGVLLQSDLGSFQLHGSDISEFVHRVLPMLVDGAHDADAICARLPEYDADSVCSILALLRSRGLIEAVNDEPGGAPPWPAHERFLAAWPDYAASDDTDLRQRRILVVGLEPWAAKLVDELAYSGVGAIHILDGETLSADDVLCHRPYGAGRIGTPRAQALQAALAETAPWCRINHEPLALDAAQSLQLAAPQPWDLVIVTLPREAQFWLAKVSAYIEREHCRALYGCLDGLESWVGPVVEPGETACWNCMRLRRLSADRQPELAHVLESSVAQSQDARRARSLLSAMAVATGEQLALEAVRLLQGFARSNLYGKVFVHNLISNKSDLHTIIPVPGCEICHFGDAPAPAVANDHSAPAHFAAMSAVSAQPLRAQNPLGTVTNLEQLKSVLAGWVDTRTGVIKQLNGHLDGLPEFPRTASAGLSAFTAGKFDPRNSGQIGSGKGLDEISAHISAIGEAIERYSAARYNLAQLRYAAISQLTGDFVDPESLVLYSGRQYSLPDFPYSRWRRKQRIHWAGGHWLGTRRPVWVPALTTYFNFSCPFEEQFCQVSSNGLAAGQTDEDAAMRATYELIERDAMMLSWYAQIPGRRLRLDSHYHGKMRLMIDELRARGIALEVYLLDVGLHVPTVVCLALGNGVTTPAVSVSLATHGDIAVAMHKALLEQGHVIPYLCYLMAASAHRPRQVHEVRTLEDHAAFYFSADKLPAFDFMRQPEAAAIGIEHWEYPVVSGIEDLRARVTGAGVDIAIVDVTAPDVRLSPFRVARAVGVHMQPIHFGEQFRRVDNPRLRRLLRGGAVNSNPHPIA